MATLADRLSALAALHGSGMLTDAEFAHAKARLLSEPPPSAQTLTAQPVLPPPVASAPSTVKPVRRPPVTGMGLALGAGAAAAAAGGGLGG